MKMCDIFEEVVEWRVIDGWPNYEVSSTGLIRNIRTQKMLQPQEHFGRDINEPYLRVSLYNGRQRVNARISRVVAYAFLGMPENDKMEVDHIDNNRKNNSVSNLEWVTPAENQRRKMARMKLARNQQ